MDKARARNVYIKSGKARRTITVTFNCPICDLGHRLVARQNGLMMFNIVSEPMTHKIAQATLFNVYIECECKGCTYEFVWNIPKTRYFKWNNTIKYHHRT